MELHTIHKNQKKTEKKRVGRGGKRGTYSGRGQKGQRARAGHRIRPAERDLIQRLPKLRGVKNRPKSSDALVINLKNIEKFTEDGILSKKILLKNKVIRRISDPVKVLGSGEIKKSIKVEDIDVSESAKKKIESAGGSIKL